MQTLTNYIKKMSDPRSGNAPRHNFCDLMTISLLCAISGGETAVDMENFGKSKVTTQVSHKGNTKKCG